MALDYKYITVLTGAGISAESGVSTFRDKDGLWARFDIEKYATPEGFAADPAEVHAFYNMRRHQMLQVAPNPAHFALARLQACLAEAGGKLTIVTQNIDNLHEQAGAEVLHMHGELLKGRCASCGHVFESHGDLSTEMACTACGRLGHLRPHVVWFGEMPIGMDYISRAVAESELFVSIGTSGSVYPAAGYVEEARSLGIPTMELNLEPSENAWAFTRANYGPAGTIVPAWVKTICGC